MSDEGTTGSGQIPGWWTPDQAGGIPAESNVDAATRMPNSASPSPGEPKKRWSLVLLTAISLVVLTAGGTIIALKLGSDEPGTTSTNQEAATPTTKRTATTESSGSSEAAGLDDGDDDPGVSLPDRTPNSNSPPDDSATSGGSTSGGSSTVGTSSGTSRGSTSPGTGGAYTLGPLTFDVPSGFTATMVAERRDDGALRSEFAGPGGQEVIVEVNVGKPSDGVATAHELAATYRDQGRLVREPYADEVGGITTGVLAIRGTADDYRSDHFLELGNNGMAVMGVDLASFDSADSLAKSVVQTLQI